MSKTLHSKLLEVKKEIGKLRKDKKNPHFKNSYIEINGLLDALNPVLESHGVLLLQPLDTVNDKPAITTMVIDIDTGEKIVSSIQLPVLQDPQKVGSSVTYFRRFSLISLLSLEAVDDDANFASGHADRVKPGMNNAYRGTPSNFKR